MLCEEQGFFLEIAGMIRGLGFTILKGVLESRNDKTRARFAVEVTIYSIQFVFDCLIRQKEEHVWSGLPVYLTSNFARIKKHHRQTEM